MKKNYTEEDYTLLEEVVRTFRYPDGTLNKIAVFISTLALVLILVLGHFVVEQVKRMAGPKEVKASELTVSEIENYITDSYLKAIDEYYKGDLNEAQAKDKIIKLLADYLSSSSAFTAEQQKEIIESISKYFSEKEIETIISDSSEHIKEIKATLEKYMSENQTSIDNLKSALLYEIQNNKQLSDQELATLKEYYDKISKLEASDFTQVNDYINEINQTLKKTIEKNQADNEQQINSLDERIKALEERTTAEDENEFNFEVKDGAYGYTIKGTFYPF
jgi:hypothetical protein